jgi:hypothetical protein
MGQRRQREQASRRMGIGRWAGYRGGGKRGAAEERLRRSVMARTSLIDSIRRGDGATQPRQQS